MAIPSMTDSDVQSLARDIGARIAEELPDIIRRLLTEQDLSSGPLQFECSLLSGQQDRQHTIRLASVDITEAATPAGTPRSVHSPLLDHDHVQGAIEATRRRSVRQRDPGVERASKRRATGGLRVGTSDATSDSGPQSPNNVIRRLKSDIRVFPQRKKRLPENPHLQPSSLDKLVNGIWDSIYAGTPMDPTEVIQQWQAIEPGHSRSLLDAEMSHISEREDAVRTVFGKMNVLTRMVSQVSRTCRSLEVIVQAQWTQSFDDRVAELGSTMTREKAKKACIKEACIDFGWTEKELRNKMAIWRGYHDIKEAGGWAALIFAGMGLYRFCKYRVSFTEETFQTLRSLRHRIEVAADCLHPNWRRLLAIVGASVERKYTGHPHDWVVCGPGDEAIPLPMTYRQWDENFTYDQLDESLIDEDAWGLYDPRTIAATTDATLHQCHTCGEKQSDDSSQNSCTCFPNFYGSVRARSAPVQVYRTPNGKNNGLLACCAFERGAAIGEFVGEITSGRSMLPSSSEALY